MTRPTRLGAGARLGAYEVVSLLGAGGMGEVYRARDTRLQRDVALKVIAFDAASDPDRLRRFELEARALAALNHPGILSVYDVGIEAGQPYVVFELLEGESLRERLAREEVPARKAVDWAAQAARGLAAAHDRGIVHRDVKPENLFVTRDGRVKILDFGLAKLLLGEETVGAAGASATLSVPTNPGTLLGTMGYMSPEQVRGGAVDARSDIFSLGALLYEMLCGRRAFRRDTAADTLSAILKEEPPDLVASVNPGLARIVRRCLEKEPQERFQSARDLAFGLEGLSQSSASLPSTEVRRIRSARALGTLLILGSIAAGAFLAGRRSLSVPVERSPPSEVRFQVKLPAAVRRVDALRLSPDGRQFVFLGVDSHGETQLWVQALNSLEARPLRGTEGVRATPFWSPDSRSIGFFSIDQLKRIDVAGGSPQMICAVPSAYDSLKSGAWGRQGVVIYADSIGGLHRVSASGGKATPLTRLDEARRERIHGYPDFLSGGPRFFYFVRSEDLEHRGVRLGSLDSAETRMLLPGEQPASYAWPGYLFLRRGPALLAQALDASRLTLAGEPFVVTDTVGPRTFSTSETGALAFAPHPAAFAQPRTFSASETGALAFAPNPAVIVQPTWFDRSGKRIRIVGEPGPYEHVALSPDERYAAIQRLDPRFLTTDIWILDLGKGGLSRFTFDPGQEADPVWAPDGRRLAFTARGEGEPELALFVKALGGGAPERVLTQSAGWAFVQDWSPDGRTIVYDSGIGGRNGLWAVSLGSDRKPLPLVPGGVPNDAAKLSPDGRFLAYMAYEAGRFEVYVQEFPAPRTRARFSSDGGAVPRWRGDGRELYYLAPDGALMAVEVKAGATLEPGVPRKLFSTGLGPNTLDLYATAADGQRFLVLMPVDSEPAPITVVLNWTAGLEK